MSTPNRSAYALIVFSRNVRIKSNVALGNFSMLSADNSWRIRLIACGYAAGVARCPVSRNLLGGDLRAGEPFGSGWPELGSSWRSAELPDAPLPGPLSRPRACPVPSLVPDLLPPGSEDDLADDSFRGFFLPRFWVAASSFIRRKSAISARKPGLSVVLSNLAVRLFSAKS